MAAPAAAAQVPAPVAKENAVSPSVAPAAKEHSRNDPAPAVAVHTRTDVAPATIAQTHTAAAPTAIAHAPAPTAPAAKARTSAIATHARADAATEAEPVRKRAKMADVLRLLSKTQPSAAIGGTAAPKAHVRESTVPPTL